MKGIYVLVVKLRSDVELNVGALGQQHFVKGFYAYVGSAQTNLEKRVSRHFRKTKRKFWHIDYLLGSNKAVIHRVLFKRVAKTEECNIAARIGLNNGPVPGFGCSDCKCESHLLHIEELGSLLRGMEELGWVSLALQ